MSHEPLRHETDNGTIVGRLREVADAALDIVSHSTHVQFRTGTSLLGLADNPHVTHDGVYDVLPITFTRTATRQQAERFDIPLKYVDLLAGQQPDLLALNFNERSLKLDQPTLYRMLRDGDHWRVRAVLSNGYQAIDNLDVMTAVIKGAANAGIDLGDCRVEADWTDDRFRLRIAVPQIAIAAPDLLHDYRSPFSSTNPHDTRPGATDAQGRRVGDIIQAGLEIANSETGGGAATIAPRAVVLACLNGMTRKVDMVRAVHIGGKLEVGPVQWSAETRRKRVELVESQMADAVNQFCSVEYLDRLANEMRAAKGIEVVNPVKAVEVAQQRLGYTDGEVESALAMFLKSGDSSVLGLGQAVTAMAQALDDGDRQSEVEQSFWAIVGEPRAFVGS